MTAVSGDERADALLNEGLDHYFAGRFEHAIHLWTRVLFLDRHHSSAKAYIERARGALAERQRRAEESLQSVARLLDESRAHEARTVLMSVVSTIGEDERTATLRARLERLERVLGGAPRIHAADVREPSRTERLLLWANRRVTAAQVGLVSALLLVTLAITSPGVRARLGWGAPAGVSTPTSAPLTVPVLSSGEVALARAQSLFARGRLADALVALDRVGAEQIERTEADRLRVEIQRVLLATADDQARQGAR
jgi:tetratricopeptide (TPR) repeat protein